MSDMVMHPLIERIKDHQENKSNKQVLEEISFTKIESYTSFVYNYMIICVHYLYKER